MQHLLLSAAFAQLKDFLHSVRMQSEDEKEASVSWISLQSLESNCHRRLRNHLVRQWISFLSGRKRLLTRGRQVVRRWQTQTLRQSLEHWSKQRVRTARLCTLSCLITRRKNRQSLASTLSNWSLAAATVKVHASALCCVLFKRTVMILNCHSAKDSVLQ